MEEHFSELFKESGIFANREVLSPHYIPQHLLFRDKQIADIEKAVTPSLRGERGRNLFIYGKTGAGKTSCMKWVMDRIREIPVIRAKITYVNCRIYNSRYRVLGKIASDHMPIYAKRGFGVTDIYEKMINWIEEDGKILIAVLDEIDMIRDLDDLIYTLARANSDMKSGGITMIGISNKVSFKDVLDPRSLSTLYENELVFPPYNSVELASILKDRAASGFKKGVIEDESLNLAAAIAAREGGDARFALKIISKAGELAEERGSKAIGTKEIQEASKFAEEDIAYEIINTLPDHQRLVLYAIAIMSTHGSRYKRLDQGDESFLLSGDIFSRYSSLAESLGKEPKSSRLYRKYIADLEMQGIITAYESGKGIRGHTRMIKLSYNPSRVKEVVEKGLFKEGEVEGYIKPS